MNTHSTLSLSLSLSLIETPHSFRNHLKRHHKATTLQEMLCLQYFIKNLQQISNGKLLLVGKNIILIVNSN